MMYYKDGVLTADGSDEGLKHLVSYLAILAIFPTPKRIVDIRLAGDTNRYIFDDVTGEIKEDLGGGTYSVVYSLSSTIIKRKKELKDYINGYLPKSRKIH